MCVVFFCFFFFFQAEDGIRDGTVTGVQTCALPIFADGMAPSDGDWRGVLYTTTASPGPIAPALAVYGSTGIVTCTRPGATVVWLDWSWLGARSWPAATRVPNCLPMTWSAASLGKLVWATLSGT